MLYHPNQLPRFLLGPILMILLFASPSPSQMAPYHFTSEPLYELTPPVGSTDSRFGLSVSGVADIADPEVGYIAVSGHNLTEGVAKVYYYRFGVEGLSPIWAVSLPVESGLIFLNGLCGIADINDNGSNDIIVGLHTSYVLDGWDGTIIHTIPSPSGKPEDCFGYQVAAVPDVNGDGIMDIFIPAGHEATETGTGRTYMFDGASGAILWQTNP